MGPTQNGTKYDFAEIMHDRNGAKLRLLKMRTR